MKGTFEHFNRRTCYDCAHSSLGPNNGPMYCDEHDVVLMGDEAKRGCAAWVLDYDAWYRCYFCGHTLDGEQLFCWNCHRHQADAPIRIKEE